MCIVFNNNVARKTGKDLSFVVFWSGRNDFELGRNDFELGRNDSELGRNGLGAKRR